MAKAAVRAKQTSSDASGPLKEAWARYEQGDVVAARQLARAVLAAQPPAAVQVAARDLISRTRMERAAFAYAALCAVLMAVLILIAVYRT